MTLTLIGSETGPVERALKKTRLPIDHGAIRRDDLPAWCAHKRGRNWMAVITISPAEAGGLHREFCRRAYGEYAYITGGLEPGQAVEIAGDYISTSVHNPRHTDRHYYVIESISAAELMLIDFPDALVACRAAEAQKIELSERQQNTDGSLPVVSGDA